MTVLLLILSVPLGNRSSQAQEPGTDRGRRAPDERALQVDEIFAAVDSPHTPGCAVSVMRRGAIVFRRGYGMANLEYDIPIVPSSVFHVASVSKQFTAMAVGLLAAEGAVSWDDEIREYVPELPDHGFEITLSDLAHHISGIRDQWELLILAGWRWEADVVRQEDVLHILSRQKRLNFAPGEEWLYSNSGYTLLAAVVERVSGMALREFVERRIFRPLGMENTHFHDDHQHIVENRAYAYEPDSTHGWRTSIPDFAIVGASSLFTTVEDLARWDRNFYTTAVGGPAVLERLHQRAVLADGDTVSYAYGLGHGTYRGLPVVGHSGADAGYRARFVRFPEQELSIAVLCNYPSSNPWLKASRVADVWLAGEFPEPAAPEDEETPARVVLSGEQLRSLEGTYVSDHTDFPIQIRMEGGQLVRGPLGARILTPLASDRFRSGGSLLRFDDFRHGTPKVLQVRDGRRTRVYTRAPTTEASEERLAEYGGRYYSEELGIEYRVEPGEGSLVVWNHKHGDRTFEPAHRDGFTSEFRALTFTRDAQGAVDGFTISTPRVRKVVFRKR